MKRKGGRSRSEAKIQIMLDIGLGFVAFLTVSAVTIILVPEEHRTWAPDLLLAGTAVVGAGATFLRSLVLARADWKWIKDERHAGLLNQIGLGLLHDVTESAKVPYYNLGVHIFVYDAGFLKNRQWIGNRRESFRRLVRLRYPADERHSGIPIRPGVGAVGLAYTTAKFVVQPVAADIARYEHDAEGWDSKPPEQRAGLTHGQLMGCTGYGYVAAHPFRDHKGVVRGCVAVDGPDDLEAKMIDHNAEIKSAMSQACVSIRRTLYYEQ